MDSGQDSLDSEIFQTGNCILELLKRTLCPDFVRDKESIVLTAPWEEEDYRVGVYLYDIQDYSLMHPQEAALSDEERRFPPKAVELCYLIFCNEKHQFGGLQRQQIHKVLNEVIRTVYDHPALRWEEGGEEVQLSFLRETVEFKIRLWGSFHQPLQPAIYLRAVPVLVASRRIRKAVRVKERDYGVKKM